MKIVQSFWSKPFLKAGNFFIHQRRNGGFIEKKYFFYSWCLSCLSISRFYEDIELITDTLGRELFLKLNLPYKRITTDLDEIGHYHPDLWAIGKIRSFQFQQSPFIHIDGDVFLWKELPQRIENAPLVAQSEEQQFNVFRPVLENVKEKFDYIPKCFETENEGMFNAGIIGGNNYLFLQEFAKDVFLFLTKNSEEIAQVNRSFFNAIFEQYYYFKLSKIQNIQVQLLFDDLDYDYFGVCDFLEIGKTQFFTHMLGKFKYYENTCRHLESRFRIEYPQHYHLINNLLENHKL